MQTEERQTEKNTDRSEGLRDGNTESDRLKAANGRPKHILVARTKGHLVEINVGHPNPAVITDGKSRKSWEEAAMRIAETLKDKIERGDILPDIIQKHIDSNIHNMEQDRAAEKMNRIIERKSTKLRWLKQEARLLELDALIKENLSLNGAEPERCMEHLNELSNLVVDPLMLKKHPGVVDTIMKLRRYIGNVPQWDMDKDQASHFAINAARIRDKADQIYNKFKALFMVPEGLTFGQVFSDKLVTFRERISQLSQDKQLSLTEDPTVTKEGGEGKQSAHRMSRRLSSLKTQGSTSAETEERQTEKNTDRSEGLRDGNTESDRLKAANGRPKHILVARTKGHLVEINVGHPNPAVITDGKSRKSWEEAAMRIAETLKDKIERGDILPDIIQKHIDSNIHNMEQDRAAEKMNRIIERKSTKLRWLKQEARLLELDALIKENLSLNGAEPERCMEHLNELSNLVVDPLMLKKHPGVVDTIMKLRRYIGNVPQWDMDKDQASHFAINAARIRDKADQIYNKFKALFMVPEGLTFGQVFSDKLVTFRERISQLSQDKQLSLTEDPTEPAAQNSLNDIVAADEDNAQAAEEEVINAPEEMNDVPESEGTLI